MEVRYKRIDWPTDGLHAYLDGLFPLYRSKRGALDVPALAKDLRLTAATVYEWLNRDNLRHPRNARALIDLANREDNLKALTEAGHAAPTPTDMSQFLII